MPVVGSRIKFEEDRRFYAVLAAVAVILGAAFLLFSRLEIEYSTLTLAWFLPASKFFLILAGTTIAYLSVARAILKREPFFLLLAVGFWISSLASFFNILVWPGLVGETSLVPAGQTTPQLFLLLSYFLVLVFVTAAPFRDSLSWRGVDRIGVITRSFLWLFTATVLTAVLCLFMVFFSGLLPGQPGMRPVEQGSSLLVILSVGSMIAYTVWRQRAESRMAIYLAIFSLLFVFLTTAKTMQVAQYDVWWYAALWLEMGAYALVLFGMLEQYVELHQEEQRLGKEVQEISETSAEIANSLDLDYLAGSLLSRSLKLTGAKYGFLDILDDQDGLEMSCVQGVMKDECSVTNAPRVSVLARQGIGKWVAENGRPALSNAVESDPRFGGLPPGHVPITNFLGVPLNLRNRVTGMIALAEKSGGFTPTDERAVSAIAGQMAVAVENARLYKKIDRELQRRIVELEALAEASKALSVTVDAKAVYESALQIVEQLFEARAAWVYRFSEQTGFLETMVYHGPQPSEMSNLRFRPGQGVLGQTYLTGDTIFVPDVQRDPRFVHKGEALRAGVNSLLCVPLSGGDKALGAISLYIPGLSTDNPPSDLQLDLLLAFASQLATAIQRAELHEQQLRQIEDLEALQLLSDKAMSAVEPDDLLEEVLKRSVEVVHANTGVMFFVDRDRAVLRPKTAYNIGERPGEELPALPFGEGLAGRVAAEGRPVRVMDAASDPLTDRAYIRRRGIQSMVCVPLVYRGETIGAMELGRLSLRHFSNHDVRLLQLAAEKVAIATERAEFLAGLKATNAQLTLRNVWLQDVIDGMPDGILILDSAGYCLMANRAAERLFGHSIPEGVPAGDLGEVLGLRTPSGEPFPVDGLAFVRAVGGEVATGQEMVVEHDDQPPTYIVCNAAPLRDKADNVTGAVAVVQDVSRLKEIDRLKDDFISIASHELKNPLTAIKGHMQLVEKRARDIGEDRRRDAKSLRIVSEQADRMARLIDDLLDISRIQTGRLMLELDTLNMTELVRGVIEQAQATTSVHCLELILEDDKEITGDWDGDRIEQVVYNLLSNAIRYSPGGGRIEVKLARAGDEAIVSVKDEGVGIPESHLPSVFDRFYRIRGQSSPNASGMGLGLYICREIVSRHGGRIWVESEEGRGSTFSFSLPGAKSR